MVHFRNLGYELNPRPPFQVGCSDNSCHTNEAKRILAMWSSITSFSGKHVYTVIAQTWVRVSNTGFLT